MVAKTGALYGPRETYLREVKSCAGFLLDKIAQLSTASRKITVTQPHLPSGVKVLW